MMDQYEARFAELSKFAPRLVEDRDYMAKRFLNGLRPNVCRHLVPLNLKDYHKLYEHAQLVEQELVMMTKLGEKGTIT